MSLRRFFLFPVIFLLSVASEAPFSSRVPPVILVPGDGGSQIEAKLDKPKVIHYLCSKKTTYWFDLWLNMELLAPLVIDCWVDNMKLVYDNVTRSTKNSPGVLTRIPGFGDSSTVEWLDPSHRSPTGYFKDIVNAILPLGYQRNITIRGAPFDFRKAPNELHEYFIMLKELIEETYFSGMGEKIVLLVHSMGAPMTLYFLNHQTQEWKDMYIETVISLAGAWGGSVKAVKVYTAGDNLGVYVISSAKVRTEQRSAPSLAFLLPSRELWGPDEVLVQTPEKNYTAENYAELFEALNLPDANHMYEDTKDLLAGSPAPGVEVHCLHGLGVATVEKLIYTKGNFPDSPTVVYGEGDGTVNKRSAELCLKWKNEQKEKIHHQEFKGVNHMQILSNKDSIKYIFDLLSFIIHKNQQNALEKMSSTLKETKEIEEKMAEKFAASGGKYKLFVEDETVLQMLDNEETTAEDRNVNRISVQSDNTFLRNGL